MEGLQYICPGCATVLSPSDIDFKARRGICPSCGSVVSLSRREVNHSQTVVHDLENAVRFFEDRNFDTAKRYAEGVLSISFDNVVALFIIAYCEAYHARNKTHAYLDKFFKQELKDIDVLEDEMQMLKGLLLKSVLHLADYEQEILQKILETQADGDIAEFVEAFSPYVINKRSNINWFSNEMANTYETLTKRANLPKTWYALYSQIATNPDSPEAENTYYLKTKTARFFNDYLLRLENVFEQIKDDRLKKKFSTALATKKANFISKMEN